MNLSAKQQDCERTRGGSPHLQSGESEQFYWNNTENTLRFPLYKFIFVLKDWFLCLLYVIFRQSVSHCSATTHSNPLFINYMFPLKPKELSFITFYCCHRGYFWVKDLEPKLVSNLSVPTVPIIGRDHHRLIALLIDLEQPRHVPISPNFFFLATDPLAPSPPKFTSPRIHLSGVYLLYPVTYHPECWCAARSPFIYFRQFVYF